TQANPYYRDDQGRTRNEFGPKGATHVMIHDPVAGYSVDLDFASKTAHKLGMPGVAGGPMPQSLAPKKAFGGQAAPVVVSDEAGAVSIKHAERMGEASKE